MEKNVEKAINNFISDENDIESNELIQKDKKLKKIVLDEREGLIERIDKQYVTSDGRILLREQY